MSKPNYSGRWQFKTEVSQLQITVPDSVVFTIEHNEPAFHLERTLVFGERSDTFALDLTTGAEQPPFVRGEATLYPSLRWDEGHLLFLTRIVRKGQESTNLVRYHLENAGMRLVAEEHFRSKELDYDNRWVFDKE